MTGLDRIDRLFLEILNRDARSSSAEIARQTGVPERTVHNRIRKLLEGGFIKPVMVVNPKAFGYDLAIDILCEIELGFTNQAVEALIAMPEISYVAISTGDQDLSIQALFKTIEDMQEFITCKLPGVPGMRRLRSELIPRIIKDSYQWLPPKESFEPLHEKRAVEEVELLNRQDQRPDENRQDGDSG